MDKRELFEKALEEETILQNHDIDHLAKLGEFIGRKKAFFKQLYKAYKFTKEEFEFKPSIGVPVKVTFNHDPKEVILNRFDMELAFTEEQLLAYLNLIDLCFFNIISIGSVVDIDLDFVSESMRSRVEKGKNRGLFVMITAQKTLLGTNKPAFFNDYMGVMWPIGTQSYSKPLFLSNVMIKNTVYPGMVNEIEETFKEKMRQQAVHNQLRSTTYLSDKELKSIKNEISDMYKQRVGDQSE